ncbi:oxidoreductase [Corticibacter populi]|uniref:Oxidoreductase n=1 Tax=Corticibacter populi TaxID=1550736 RepID=A0A3M6QMF0_9BURK|nr:PDR/VanB family oxidoreductase [Corticibacter populi]RMX04226.1 oxidoreductase [Corticibacter populi]RZS33260.1 vanillate O-demethylase ferredoxin subunit [Corticibacter populi]
MSTSSSLIDVQVDALVAQGQGNLAVRLIPPEGHGPLPAFDAGAHVDLHLPTGMTRQYSIASAPHQRDFYTLCIRKEGASRGGSRYVHERLRVGDRLRIGAPRNLFRLEPAAHSILMAGGIGITPLLSMAWALEQGGQSFELHYYVRRRSEAAFARQWGRGFRHGTVHLHCSAEGDSLRAGRPACLAAPGCSTHLYVCGPHGFMDHVQAQAHAAGWPMDQLHQEAFGLPAAAVSSGLAEEEAPFEVELASTGQAFVVPPGQSIASVLQSQGVEIPLSCEMGICGACLTPVSAGDVEHRDGVQSEAEKSAPCQQIALCCSRSRSARLVLQL